METKFNEQRTWGVEIEFLSTVDRYALARAIMNKGVSCQVVGYTHAIMNCWKITTDASAGFEMVSPILKGAEGFRQLKVVCDTMKEFNCKVNKTCGLHVHQDAHDFTKNDFAKLFGLYYKFEKTIDSMMPVSRRDNNNTYCHSLRNIMIDQLKGKTIQEIASLYHFDRYHKLNTQSFVKYGTIEFRHHSGTIEYEKIMNWIMFTNLMITKATTASVHMTYDAHLDTWSALRKTLNLFVCGGADEATMNMVKFYEKRIASLNKTHGEEVAA